MVQNSRDIKNKATMISSLMRNPKLAKTISDAFSSPVGSTKNENARKILRSLNKVNNNYNSASNDGQGGIGGDAMNWVNQTFVNPLKNFASTIQNPTNPNPEGSRIKTLQSIDNTINAPTQGSPISLDPKLLGGSRAGRTATAIAGAVAEWPRALGEKIASLPSNYYPYWGKQVSKIIMPGVNYLLEDPELNKAYTNLIDVNGEIRTKDGQTKFGSEAELAKYLDVLPGQIDWNKIEKQTSAVPVGIEKQVPEETKIGTEGRKIITVQGRKLYADTGQPVEETFGETQISQLPSVGEGQYDYNKLDPNDTIFNQLAGITAPSKKITAKEGTLLRKAQESAASFEGKTTFIYESLLDPVTLAKDLKMSPEAASVIPKVFLQDTIDELTSALNKEYQIDTMRNDLTAKINQGLTLEENFTDYIRGKDEYLKKIDNLLDDANEKIANMDTSNPYVAQRCKYYTNYLTILKGRQNKRYIDFLNMGIKQWNAELTAETNLYNSNLASYNEALESKVGRATEWDKMVRDMLGEMYDSVEKMEDRQIKIESANRDKMKDNLDIALDTLKLQRGGVEPTQTERDRTLKTTALQKYVPEQNVDGSINLGSYMDQRLEFIANTGLDGKDFDDAYISGLSEEDRASFIGKPIEPMTIDYDKLVAEYLAKEPKWTRQQIEDENKDPDTGTIPVGLTIALDKVFGKKKKGLFGLW